MQGRGAKRYFKKINFNFWTYTPITSTFIKNIQKRLKMVRTKFIEGNPKKPLKQNGKDNLPVRKPIGHTGGLTLPCNLNGKEKKFCERYVYDWNGVEAYHHANPTVAYSTCGTEASKLLKKSNIQDYINILQQNIEKQSNLSALMVLDEYKKMAFSNIANLHNTWIEKKDFDDLTDEEKACIAEISTRVTKKVVGSNLTPEGESTVWIQVEEIKLKLHDKTKALEAIRKMLGYDAPDKLDIQGAMTFKEPEQLKTEDLSNPAQKLLLEIASHQLTQGISSN